MTFTADRVREMCHRLLRGERHYEALQVTAEEFRVFYVTLSQLKGAPPKVSLVNLETLVKGQFSDVSPQHFDIRGRRPLSERDFDFILEKKWYGPRERPEGFLRFIWGETRLNWLKLLPVFALGTGLLYAANDDELYSRVGAFLVQSATVFLSIYLIFTVSQSQKLGRDLRLFRSGTIHRYYRDDRNITVLGILTIGLSFLATGVVSLASRLQRCTKPLWIQTTASVLKAVSTGIVVTLLFETFITVASYYLERDRDVADRDMAAGILDEDYRHYLPGQREPAQATRVDSQRQG